MIASGDAAAPARRRSRRRGLTPRPSRATLGRQRRTKDGHAMPRICWEARTRSGEVKKGVMEADDARRRSTTRLAAHGLVAGRR